MEASEFCTGLMLALRVNGTELIDTDSDRFYSAFMVVVEEARQAGHVDALRDAQMDPVFRVVPLASQMILDAMQDGLVAMESHGHQWVRYTISQKRALEELSLVHQSTGVDFLSLAYVFTDAMASHPSPH